jgi:hypothetical protein
MSTTPPLGISLFLRGETTRLVTRYVFRVLCYSHSQHADTLQVFISYGSVPNSRLLRLYGFVLAGNPNENYDLVLTTQPNAPFFEQKQKLWASAGLDSTVTISLTLADPLPNQVLQYLRIQRLDRSDLAAMALQQVDGTDKKVGASNEVEILQFLVESICSLLAGFGTQLETLEEQLSKGVYSKGGNAWAAAHVSLGEQRVLRLARKKAKDLLAKVKGKSANGRDLGSLSVARQCANCNKDSAQLMLCGRCKAAAYCGRACQVAHFKEHKATCRTLASNRIL